MAAHMAVRMVIHMEILTETAGRKTMITVINPITDIQIPVTAGANRRNHTLRDIKPKRRNRPKRYRRPISVNFIRA